MGKRIEQVGSIADPNPHQSEKQDSDPHRSEKVEAWEGHYEALGWRVQICKKKWMVGSGSGSAWNWKVWSGSGFTSELKKDPDPDQSEKQDDADPPTTDLNS